MASDHPECKIRGIFWVTRHGFDRHPVFHELSAKPANWRPDPHDRRANKRRRWSLELGEPGQTVFLKYFRPRNMLEPLRFVFKSTRAAREWRNSLRLEKIGIPVPVVLALGERRPFKFWRQSFLVSESFAGAKTLLQWSERFPADPRNRLLCFEVAKHLAHMHEQGYFHRDLHGDNILVVESNGNVQIRFLDFYELTHADPGNRQYSVEDLARLNGFVAATKWQRIRFLRDYLKQIRPESGQLRDWLTAVDQETRRLWQYYLGKGVDYRRY